MKKAGIATAFGLMAGLWALGASAAPITVSYTGFTQGSQSGTISGVRNVGVNAGQFGFNVLDDGGVYWDTTLQGFCIDVTTNLVVSGPVQYDLVAATSSSRLNAQQLSLIGSLYDQHAGSLTTATNSAAFQLALWEILYDPGTLQLTNNGSFHASAFGGNARSVAQGWLNGLDNSGSYVASHEFWVLESPLSAAGKLTTQSLLVARPAAVPEPGTLALLGMGLLACGIAGRRRVRQ